jgi:hypothetical protein
VFTARYALSPYIKQIRFAFKAWRCIQATLVRLTMLSVVVVRRVQTDGLMALNIQTPLRIGESLSEVNLQFPATQAQIAGGFCCLGSSSHKRPHVQRNISTSSLDRRRRIPRIKLTIRWRVPPAWSYSITPRLLRRQINASVCTSHLSTLAVSSFGVSILSVSVHNQTRIMLSMCRYFANRYLSLRTCIYVRHWPCYVLQMQVSFHKCKPNTS